MVIDTRKKNGFFSGPEPRLFAHRGASALRGLCVTHGPERVRHFMDALGSRAEGSLRAALRRMPQGSYEAEERLDDGSPIRVRIGLASSSRSSAS